MEVNLLAPIARAGTPPIFVTLHDKICDENCAKECPQLSTAAPQPAVLEFRNMANSLKITSHLFEYIR